MRAGLACNWLELAGVATEHARFIAKMSEFMCGSCLSSLVEGGVLFLSYPLGALPHPDDYALFPAREGSTVRKIPALLLPRYERAYCLSVHKSQGSEFDHVLLVMPEGAESFGRELFYTAVTRARKQIEIFGAAHTITATINQKSQRHSGIARR